jgi:hypothetical protein
MYIAVRNYFPDPAALERCGVLRRLPCVRDERGLPAPSRQAAAYCCQCTWASVVAPQVRLREGAAGVAATAEPLLTAMPLDADPALLAALAEAPATSTELKDLHWICKGHHPCVVA